MRFTLPFKVLRKPNHLLVSLFLLLFIMGPGSGCGGDPVEKVDAPGPACVILLHGLGRTSRSLTKMEGVLADAGFVTVNIDYPSQKGRVEDLAREFIPAGLSRCAQEGATAVHFVTHSLGGILVRYYLTQERLENLGRVVMLSPPNQGSEAADLLKERPWYLWINGPAGQQLVTDASGLAGQLGPVDYPVGVITGNRHAFFDAWLAKSIPGEDDGKVSVERAKVEGMAGFLVLPYPHPFIMDADDVIAQTVHFLETGAFSRELPPGDSASP